MPADINDKITSSSSGVRPVNTTVSNIRNSGGTTLSCADLTGWPTASAVHFVTYKIDGTGSLVVGSQSDWKGIVSGSNITSLSLTGGSDNGNAIGDVVVCLPTARYGKELYDALSTEHTQSGKHAITAGSTINSATITTPNIITSINDTNSNELLKVTPTASAVNEITVANAATGNAPSLTASGGDLNVDVTVAAKGTGNINLNAGTGGSVKKNTYPIDWWEEIGRTTLTSAGDTITVSGLPARKYLRLMIFTIPTGGTNSQQIRFNNDSGTNYTQRYADNDSADSVTSSIASFNVDVGLESTPVWIIIDLVNMTNQEKICIASVTCIKASGSVTAPTRRNTVGKWANTSSQINRIDLINGGTGDFAIGSEVVVLGHN